MTEIDDEIVRFQFDNREFEEGVAESMSTLDKLKARLNFKNAGDSIESEMNRSVTATERLANQFEKLHTVIGKVVDDLKQKLANTIEKTLSGFTVDNVMAGWSKYAQKTTAVATLIGQDYEMDRVEKTLEKLNWFTDETSYNFTTMVESIGKFTASGQSLENAATAMEGIATWAALSGQNATKASMAMYQLSQAMGKGALKYDDYKSIQNAGMDTMQFRERALAAAEALGTLKKTADGVWTVLDDDGNLNKKMTVTMQDFTSHLSDGMWFTSDVMMKVFSEYGSAIEDLEKLTDNGKKTAAQAVEDAKTNNKLLVEQYRKREELGEKEMEKKLLYYKDQYSYSEQTIENLAESTDLQKEITDKEISAIMERDKVDSEQAKKTAAREKAEAKLMQRRENVVAEYAKKFGISTKQANKELKKFSGYVSEFGIKAFEAAGEAKTFGEAMESVADAASTAWSDTFEQIFGNYETAKKVWTGLANYLYDAFVSPVWNINEVVAKWAKTSSRDTLFEAFKLTAEGFENIASMVSKAIRAIFGKFNVGKLTGFTQGFHDIADFFSTITKEINESQGFKNLIYLLKNTVKIINELTAPVEEEIYKISGMLVNIGGGIIGDIVTGFRYLSKSLKNNQTFLTTWTATINALGGLLRTIISIGKILYDNVIKPIGQAVGKFAFDALINGLTNVIGLVGALANWLGNNLASALVNFAPTIKSIVSIFNSLFSIGKATLRNLLNTFDNLIKKVLKLFGITGDKLKSLNIPKLINDVTSLVAKEVKKMADVLSEKGLFKGVFDTINNIINAVGGVLINTKNAAVPFLNNVTKTFGNFLDMFKPSEIGKVEDGAKSVSLFDKAIRALSEGLTNFKGVCASVLDWFNAKWDTAMKNENFASFVNFFCDLFTEFLIPTIKRFASLAKTIVVEASYGQFTTLANVIHDLGIIARNVFSVFASLGWTRIIYGIGTTFTGIKEIFVGIGDLVWNFAEIGNEIKKTIKSVKWLIRSKTFETIVEALKKLVTTVAIIFGLALAMAMLPDEVIVKMDSTIGAVLKICAFMGLISAALAALSSASLKGTVGSAALLLAMTAMVSTITLLVGITSILFKIGDPNRTTEAMKFIMIIVGMVFAVLFYIAKQSSLVSITKKSVNKLEKAAGTIAAIAVFIGVIGFTLKSIVNSEGYDIHKYAQAMLGILAIIFSLFVGLKYMGQSVEGSVISYPKFWSMIGLLLLISAGVLPAVKDLAKMSYSSPEATWNACLQTIVIIGSIFAAMTIMAKNMPKNALKGNKFTFVLLSLAAVLMSIGKYVIPSLIEAGKASPSDMDNIATALGGTIILMAAVFAGLYKLTKAGKKFPSNALTMIAALVIALKIGIMPAINEITELNDKYGSKTIWIGIVEILAGVAAMLTAFYVAARVFKKHSIEIKTSGTVKAAISLAILIWTISDYLIPALDSISQSGTSDEGVANTWNVVIATAAMMTAAIKVFSDFSMIYSSSSFKLKHVIGFAAIIFGIKSLVTALGSVTGNWDSILAAGASLIGFAEVLLLGLKHIDGINVSIPSIGKIIGIIALIRLGLVPALLSISDMVTANGMLNAFHGLIIMIGGLASVVGALVGLGVAVAKIEGFSLAGMGRPMVAIAALLYVMSNTLIPAVTGLASANWSAGSIDAATYALVGCGVLLAETGLILGMLSKYSGEFATGPKTIANGIAIILTMVGISKVMGPLTELSNIDFASVIGAAIAMGILVGAIATSIGGMAKLMSGDGSVGKFAIAVVGLISLVRIISNALVPAMMQLASADQGAVWSMVLALTALIAVCELALVIAGKFSSVISLAAIGKLALGIIGIAAAILILTFALESLCKFFTKMGWFGMGDIVWDDKNTLSNGTVLKTSNNTKTAKKGSAGTPGNAKTATFKSNAKKDGAAYAENYAEGFTAYTNTVQFENTMSKGGKNVSSNTISDKEVEKVVNDAMNQANEVISGTDLSGGMDDAFANMEDNMNFSFDEDYINNMINGSLTEALNNGDMSDPANAIVNGVSTSLGGINPSDPTATAAGNNLTSLLGAVLGGSEIDTTGLFGNMTGDLNDLISSDEGQAMLGNIGESIAQGIFGDMNAAEWIVRTLTPDAIEKAIDDIKGSDDAESKKNRTENRYGATLIDPSLADKETYDKWLDEMWSKYYPDLKRVDPQEILDRLDEEGLSFIPQASDLLIKAGYRNDNPLSESELYLELFNYVTFGNTEILSDLNDFRTKYNEAVQEITSLEKRNASYEKMGDWIAEKYGSAEASGKTFAQLMWEYNNDVNDSRADRFKKAEEEKKAAEIAKDQEIKNKAKANTQAKRLSGLEKAIYDTLLPQWQELTEEEQARKGGDLERITKALASQLFKAINNDQFFSNKEAAVNFINGLKLTDYDTANELYGASTSWANVFTSALAANKANPLAKFFSDDKVNSASLQVATQFGKILNAAEETAKQKTIKVGLIFDWASLFKQEPDELPTLDTSLSDSAKNKLDTTTAEYDEASAVAARLADKILNIGNKNNNSSGNSNVGGSFLPPSNSSMPAIINFSVDGYTVSKSVDLAKGKIHNMSAG